MLLVGGDRVIVTILPGESKAASASESYSWPYDLAGPPEPCLDCDCAYLEKRGDVWYCEECGTPTAAPTPKDQPARMGAGNAEGRKGTEWTRKSHPNRNARLGHY
jgi:hypothetical protein